MKVCRWLLVGLSLLLLAGCGRQLTPDQARALVQKVQQARRTLSMEGKLTTAIRVRGEEMRADAEMSRGPGVVRLKYVSGRFAGWQIIEQDGLVWRVSPQGQPSASPIGPEAGLGIPPQGNLQVQQSVPTRVAGRWARRYTILPAQQQAGKLVLALDARTGYPLQMLRYGSDKQLISATTYRQVRYDVAPPPRVTPPAVAQHHGPGRGGWAGTATTEAALVKLLGGPLLKPSYIPSGLQLRGYYSRQLRRGTLAEMRYSDGLRTLVVAQVKVHRRDAGAAGHGQDAPGAQAARERWQQRHATGQGAPGAPGSTPNGWWQRFRGRGSAQGEDRTRGALRRNMLRERRGDRVVVVGGDLPADELRQVMASIPTPPGQKPGTKF